MSLERHIFPLFKNDHACVYTFISLFLTDLLVGHIIVILVQNHAKISIHTATLKSIKNHQIKIETHPRSFWIEER